MTTINLTDLERILYNESSVIDPDDVPLLMLAVYSAVDAEVPQKLIDECEEIQARYQ